jgi:hypothetical protein
MTLYVSVDEVRAALRDTVTANVTEIEAATLAACSSIDAHCNRTFGLVSVASPRVFIPPSADVMFVDDIADTTNLVIVDSGATLPAAAYQLEIAPGIPGPISVSGRTMPYMCVRRLSSRWVADADKEATVTITARWGWLTVPEEVKLAAKLLAKDYFEARDTRFGVANVGDFGRRIAENGLVNSMLEPLVRLGIAEIHA